MVTDRCKQREEKGSHKEKQEPDKESHCSSASTGKEEILQTWRKVGILFHFQK